MHLTIKQEGNEVKLKVLDGSILSMLIMKNPDTIFIAQNNIDETPGPIEPDVLYMNSITNDFKSMYALRALVEFGKWSFNDAIRLVSRIEALENHINFEVDARYSTIVCDMLNRAGCDTRFRY